MRKGIFSITLFAVLAFASCSSQESLQSIKERVFKLAESQYIMLDAEAGPDEYISSVKDGSPVHTPLHGWCSGFFPGTLWMIYESSGNENIKQLAVTRTKALEKLVYGPISHDIGFQINCSYGNAYRATGDEAWLQTVEKAAYRLSERFNPVIGCTRSWDGSGPDGTWEFPVIVDNMMNLELLMNASAHSGNEVFADIARTHADKTMANHFREDYSCWHVVDYSPATGEVNKKVTHQGYSDNSVWSRGEAWGLYGFTMMYDKTGDRKYLEQACHIGDMLLERLPEDGIPYWDFDCPDIPDTFRDASAGAIMASAFISLSELSGRKEYFDMAEKQIRTLAGEEYLSKEGENCGFLLKHSVGSLPGGSEIDVPISYADYYFIEALSKL